MPVRPSPDPTRPTLPRDAAVGPRRARRPRGLLVVRLALAAVLGAGLAGVAPAHESPASSRPPAVSGDRLDVNTASAAELAERLPGIGPAKAAAVVAHREAHGPFASVESLVEVRGIGPKTLERLRPLVGVGPALERRAREAERATRAALARAVERVRAGRPDASRDEAGASAAIGASVVRTRRPPGTAPPDPDG